MQRERLNGDRATAAWLCLADTRTCRLLKASRTNTGRWHIDEIDQLENKWEDDKQHSGPHEIARQMERGRPSHVDNDGHKDEERRRFAKDAAGWIASKLDKNDIDDLHLFAASKMMGEMRNVADQKIWSRTTEHESELNSIPTGELAKHPAIKNALKAD